jgi:hypothetical protein
MTTSTRTDYENFLLREVKDLPESELRKVLKMIHFFKEEILQTESEEGKDLRMFWESFGSWQDERSAEEIIHEIYESRKSSGRDTQL